MGPHGDAFPAILDNYRRRFRFVLVDEYQDTNHAQYRLVRQLTGAPGEPPGVETEGGQLTVVGDSDQSIYAFRGADIRNIVDFEHDYPDATVIRLEQNYRSTQTILDAANAVIAQTHRGRSNACGRRKVAVKRLSAMRPNPNQVRPSGSPTPLMI